MEIIWIPTDLVLDRDKQTVSKFWEACLTAISVETRISTALHPENDSQIEIVTHTIEVILMLFFKLEMID
jgi:hypothetical protein